MDLTMDWAASGSRLIARGLNQVCIGHQPPGPLIQIDRAAPRTGNVPGSGQEVARYKEQR